MEQRLVAIESKVDGKVLVKIPELHLRRVFPQKGSKVSIPMDVMREAMYYKGLSVLLETGALYIVEKSDRVELGFEEEEENKIVFLNEGQMTKMLKLDSASEMEKVMSTLATAQLREVAEFAIKKQILDMEKSKIIKNYTGIDVIKAVQLAEQNKEE